MRVFGYLLGEEEGPATIGSIGHLDTDGTMVRLRQSWAGKSNVRRLSIACSDCSFANLLRSTLQMRNPPSRTTQTRSLSLAGHWLWEIVGYAERSEKTHFCGALCVWRPEASLPTSSVVQLDRYSAKASLDLAFIPRSVLMTRE